MQSVEAGRLPRELGDDDKDVEIINNKSQEYVPPKRDITKLEGTNSFTPSIVTYLTRHRPSTGRWRWSKGWSCSTPTGDGRSKLASGQYQSTLCWWHHADLQVQPQPHRRPGEIASRSRTSLRKALRSQEGLSAERIGKLWSHLGSRGPEERFFGARDPIM